MNSDEFQRIFEDQITRCRDVLVERAGQYASDTDRLHNFKTASYIAGITPQSALAGMMAKHTVSVYDLCRGDTLANIEIWNEKLTDHINYLILLKALVVEGLNEKLRRNDRI